MLTVVAIGGDRIRLADTTVYVNDTVISGFLQDSRARVVRSPERTPETVPAGHYFVMGETRTSGGNVSEWPARPATASGLVEGWCTLNRR